MSTALERALEWAVSGETGSSSKALCARMLGQKIEWPQDSYPRDNEDLGRCLGLLIKVPEWRPRIKEMADVSGGWAALVAEWDVLEQMYWADKGSRALYDKMRALLKPWEDSRNNFVRLGPGASVSFRAR